jgi:hypothetical protein
VRKKAGLSVLARLGLPAARTRRRRGPIAAALSRLDVLRDLERTIGVELATRRVLLYFVVPLWLGAGFLDWVRHRRTHIETTAGTRESAIHALMLTEAGLPALMGLFLEVNAGVLLAGGAAFLAHEATAMWDVSYAEPRRRVTPAEQHIHSFLEVVPLMALSFLAALHWDQARALVGAGGGPARFALRPKRPPLPRRYVGGVLAGIVAFGVLPYAEEFRRCYRIDRNLAARPEPPLPATPTLRAPDA